MTLHEDAVARLAAGLDFDPEPIKPRPGNHWQQEALDYWSATSYADLIQDYIGRYIANNYRATVADHRVCTPPPCPDDQDIEIVIDLSGDQS